MNMSFLSEDYFILAAIRKILTVGSAYRFEKRSYFYIISDRHFNDYFWA